MEPDLGRELKQLLKLAVPLSVGYAGSTLLGFVDTAFVGRLGSGSLAAVGIGNGIFFALTLVGMGLVNGTDPLIAQALGAGDEQTARVVLWQGIRLSAHATLPLFAVLLALMYLLESFGIDPETARLTRAFVLGRALNAPTFMLFAACRGYLQAHGSTRAIVASMVVANVANFALDGVLIFGDRGLVAVGLPAMHLPALGVFGAGLSSTIASLVPLGMMALAIAQIPVPRPERVRERDPVLYRKALALGTPIALQLLAEVGAFTLATLFAGRMGQRTVAGHHIALSLASFTFTAALGVASATTVQVGRAVGNGDAPAARRTGFLGFGVGSAFMMTCAVVFFCAPGACARVLTDDPEVIAVAIPLVRIAAFFQLSDGAQVVFGAALRGCGDTKFSQYANMFGHYVVGIPIAIWLGFYADFGARGVWIGLLAGLTTVGLLLGARFERLSRKTILRA